MPQAVAALRASVPEVAAPGSLQAARELVLAERTPGRLEAGLPGRTAIRLAVPRFQNRLGVIAESSGHSRTGRPSRSLRRPPWQARSRTGRFHIRLPARNLEAWAGVDWPR